MLQLTNAFSISMLPSECNRSIICFKLLNPDEAAARLRSGFESFVGHADTAALITTLLTTPVTVNRGAASLTRGPILVAQYQGPRLAEGTTILPQGAEVKFYLVTEVHNE